MNQEKEEITWHHDEPWDETLNGVIVPMSPNPGTNHAVVTGNLLTLFARYLEKRTDYENLSHVGVFLTEKDCFLPDMTIFNQNLAQWDGVHGAPELVAEVLFSATAGRDRGYKMRVYEQCGVPELWLITPGEKTVEQYFLEDGRYRLHDVYAIVPEWTRDWIPEQRRWVRREQTDVVFHCRLFPELDISLNELFRDMIE